LRASTLHQRRLWYRARNYREIHTIEGLMKTLLRLVLLAAFAVTASAAEEIPAHPHIKIETTEGVIVLELDGRRAPITVYRFLQLVDSGYYDGTVFHRVIPGFMAQGGGFTPNLTKKEAPDPIANESGNGLQNKRGTIAMARLGEPHTASNQFFINVADNKSLNPQRDRWGYAVFGEVIEGMDVVNKIVKVKTGPAGQFPSDVPVVPVVIEKMSRFRYGE